MTSPNDASQPSAGGRWPIVVGLWCILGPIAAGLLLLSEQVRVILLYMSTIALGACCGGEGGEIGMFFWAGVAVGVLVPLVVLRIGGGICLLARKHYARGLLMTYAVGTLMVLTVACVLLMARGGFSVGAGAFGPVDIGWFVGPLLQAGALPLFLAVWMTQPFARHQMASWSNRAL